MTEIIEVHTSEFSTYNACPRMYFYQYKKNLVPKQQSHKLFLGTGVHKGLAVYYMEGTEAALRAYDNWAKLEMQKLEENLEAMFESVREDYEADIALGRKMLINYFKWAKMHDTFKVLSTEQPFEISIVNPDTGEVIPNAIYAGTFDGIAEDINGNIWLMEHKTYKSVPSDTELRLNLQAGLYLLAANRIFKGAKVLGVIYTILKKVDPDKAKSDCVIRKTVVRNGYEILNLERRLYNLYKRLSEDKTFIPTPGFHCGWMCPYTQLCISEEDGSDWTQLINDMYNVEPREKIHEMED